MRCPIGSGLENIEQPENSVAIKSKIEIFSLKRVSNKN